MNSKAKYIDRIMLILLLLPLCMHSQISWDERPMDLSLVARSGTTGTVTFSGTVDNSAAYNRIKVEVFEDGVPYATLDDNLSYGGNPTASFSINASIEAKKSNYSFEVYLRIGGTYSNTDLIGVGFGNNVVAGDVYVIQGQSNAVAHIQDGSNASSSQNSFTRVYAYGQEIMSDLILNDSWYIADVNNNIGADGNSGQWGAKLADLIIENNSLEIPIALFNGARGGKPIHYFDENYSGSLDDDPDANNYERLKYRLDKTGLADDVKAIFWSQGENVSSTINNYKNQWLSLRSSWLADYPSITKFYIFQTINGCNAYSNGNFYRLMFSKEAQRQLAEENNDIQIVNTDGLVQSSDGCHFIYGGGYEGFAERIYPFVLKDFYSGPNIDDDISPNITDAYLTDDVTLVIQTNVSSLTMNNASETIKNFVLKNANSAIITDVSVSAGDIIFTLSKYPGSNATISNEGAIPGIQNYLIKNGSSGPEILSFDEYPISDLLITVWSSSSWSNGVPSQSLNTIIDDDYSVGSSDLITKDLKVNSSTTLDVDNGNNNGVQVSGDLLVNGTMIIGDTEFLIIDDSNAEVTINGSFTKLEKTTSLASTYEVTYWGSSVNNETLNDAFVSQGVNANRIFYYDAKTDNTAYTGTYAKYRHWHIPVASTIMNPGIGFSVDGPDNGGYEKQVEFSFSGTPNYENINVSIGTFDPHGDDPVNKVNLLANPYPSAIDAQEVISENLSNFEGSLYIWSHGNDYVSGEYEESDYITYTMTGSNSSLPLEPYYIASGQGFMIMTDELDSNFSFLNSMQRLGGNDQFFKIDKKKTNQNDAHTTSDKVWLKLTKDSGLTKEILIGFNPESSSDYDKGYDGKLLNRDQEMTFYSMINDKKVVVQSLGFSSAIQRIPLGFSTENNGQFSVGITKAQGSLENYDLILKDKQLSLFHNLNESSYVFFAEESGDFRDRFELVFKSMQEKNEEVEKAFELIVLNRDQEIEIQSSEKISQILFYDIFGRVLKKKYPESNKFSISSNDIKKGTFIIIHAENKKGDSVTKKIITY